MSQKKSSTKSQATNYYVVLDVFGEKNKAKGQTLEKALENLKLDWQNTKGKGVLTVSKGAKEHTHLLNRGQMVRIGHNKIARATWAKNLDLLLNN